MAEDLDVEAMLEAPFDKVRKEGKPPLGSCLNVYQVKTRDRDRKRSRSRSRSKDKRDKRSRSRERAGHRRSRSRSRERKHKRSRSKDRERDRGDRSEKDRPERERPERERPERERKREEREPREGRESAVGHYRRRSPPPRWNERWNGRRGRFGDRSRSRSPVKPMNDLPPEERDQRTVFCMQLAARIRTRDLEEFFSAVGKVREVRLIMDNKTRRHKGIAYIEFFEINSVPLALALNGQKLCGYPIIIQPTQAEKNRAAASASAIQRGVSGPMRLYVGSLHFNITEEMLKGIFEPFGRIDKIELMRDPENGRSKGYGFITFHDAEDAKKALEQLNGFELAGRPMKVNHVTERTDITVQGPSLLDSDEMDRTGIDLGTTGRLQLMAKLAEGTGIQLPQAAVTALQMGQAAVAGIAPGTAQATPASASVSASSSAAAIATQCFLLTNMFDASDESDPKWDDEVRNDVIEECRKHGGALHVYVDKNSTGNVYVKCPSIAAATACVTALHGRWFSGRMVTAAYVPVINYHNLFADSSAATTPL